MIECLCHHIFRMLLSSHLHLLIIYNYYNNLIMIPLIILFDRYNQYTCIHFINTSNSYMSLLLNICYLKLSKSNSNFIFIYLSNQEYNKNNNDLVKILRSK